MLNMDNIAARTHGLSSVDIYNYRHDYELPMARSTCHGLG